MKQKHWLSGGVLFFIRYIARTINTNLKAINDLNLFPVADSDTGTNLLTTLQGVAKDIDALPRKTKPKQMLEALARSANLHARGNSGTILAAIITGIVERIKDAEQLTPQLLTEALENANCRARESVHKPTEGTMLTVIRDMAVAARKALDSGATSTEEMAKPILLAAKRASDESAEIMRQVLNFEGAGKDAGASALSLMVEEAVLYMTSKIDGLGIDLWEEESSASNEQPSINAPFPEDAPWEPGTPLYCTEFIIHIAAEYIDLLKPKFCLDILAGFGNSEICNVYEDIAKIHVHTDMPWDVLSHFARYGDYANVKIENMRLQNEERNRVIHAATKKPLGIIAVATGDGIKELLTNSEVDIVIDGGQTNNPEVAEIYEAIHQVNAETAVVLPGNKNVVSTAERACKMAAEDGFTAITIPTHDLPQNIAAIIAMPPNFEPDDDLDELRNKLQTAAQKVRSASITTAAKDYSDGTVTAMSGQYISLINDKVTLAHENFLSIIQQTIQELATKDSTIITVYLGADFKLSDKHLRKVIAKFTDLELEIVQGGQPIYPAIISVD